MLRLLLFFAMVNRLSLAADSEESMTIVEIIRHWGYPVEELEVHTRDGYILSMYRIPRGRHEEASGNSSSSSCGQRPAILFVHGLTADSAEFVLNPPETSPTMILADAGFDVFLLNHRGSTHSRKHVRLSPQDEEFWQFTLDEYANYDATAAVDKVLEVTGATSLFWIGHSQAGVTATQLVEKIQIGIHPGTTVGFMMLADKPQYNQKVRALFQIAPAGTAHYTRGSIRVFKLLYNLIKRVIALTGSFEIAQRASGFPHNFARFACVDVLPAEMCYDLLFSMGGPPSGQFNQSRLPVYTNNFPCGSSAWNILHWAQLASRNQVDHFDMYGEQNLKKYGKIAAPSYNFSRIKSDVYLFWSRNDWTTSPQEIGSFLMRELKSLRGTFEIAEYSHFDFAVATNNAKRVYDVIRLAKSYEFC